MERYGLNHDQAVEHMKQVAEDEEIAKAVLPQELTPPASETMPSEEQDARTPAACSRRHDRGRERLREARGPTRPVQQTTERGEATDGR